jgi:hypothetical protein
MAGFSRGEIVDFRSQDYLCGCFAARRNWCVAVMLEHASVIPGRRQRVRAKRGPMSTNPESSDLIWIPGSLARARAPE